MIDLKLFSTYMYNQFVKAVTTKDCLNDILVAMVIGEVKLPDIRLVDE